jgi:NADH-quinone oxidoreductase subunit L
MSNSLFFWLIPVLPLVVFALLTLGLTRYGRLATGLAIAAMGGAVLLSGLSFVAVLNGQRTVLSLPWLSVGGRVFSLSLWLDPLSALMATLVSLVGCIVFVYAATYMARDPRRGRFFAELSLFAGSMLLLVLAADLITLFIAWELVGLCSYLLIGFWFEREGAPAAAAKAFFITRLADLLLLAGILLLIGAVGTGRIPDLLSGTLYRTIDPPLFFFIALLLFSGAAGKSAQVPFQGWLPDAMAGPTPVSALLHSATMVAAGVFLVARLYPLFLSIPSVLEIIAWIGVITSVVGGSAALVETDLKRTLAYSTMSQIGLMFVGLGSGSLLAGMLLLCAQAFYKATLFLSAGAIDHEVGGTAFARMGGLLQRIPLTSLAFAISGAALAGLPVTLALPPKDPVLSAAWFTSTPLFLIALVASLLTALYSARLFGLVFLGIPSAPAQKAREAERGLLLPVLVAAGLIFLVLLLNAPLLGSPLSRLLSVSTPDTSVVTVLALTVALLGVACGLWARWNWREAVVWPPLLRVQPVLIEEFGLKACYRLIASMSFRCITLLGTFDRLVFDTIIDGIVAGVLDFTHLCSRVDRQVFDTFASSLARATLALVSVSNRFDIRVIDRSLTSFSQDVLRLSQRLRRLQTGRIENYMLVVFLWGVAVVAVAVVAIIIR